MQVLFNLKGVQRLDDLGVSGKISATDAVIVWDESKDGPLPKGAPVGYAQRVVNNKTVTLVADPVMKSAFDSAASAKAAKDAQDAQDVTDLAAAKAKINSGTSTNSDIVTAVKILIKKLGQ